MGRCGCLSPPPFVLRGQGTVLAPSSQDGHHMLPTQELTSLLRVWSEYAIEASSCSLFWTVGRQSRHLGRTHLLVLQVEKLAFLFSSKSGISVKSQGSLHMRKTCSCSERLTGGNGKGEKQSRFQHGIVQMENMPSCSCPREREKIEKSLSNLYYICTSLKGPLLS